MEKERKRVHYTTLRAEATPFGRTLPMSEGLVKAALPSNTRPTSPVPPDKQEMVDKKIANEAELNAICKVRC